MTKLALKKIIATVFLFGFSLTLAAPSLAAASGTYNFSAQSGLDVSANNAGYATGANASSVTDLVGTAIYAVLTLVGVIFLGLIIFGALTWMTAEGNEQKVTQANKILMGALFGLIIIVAAYAITYFVLNFLFT